MRHKRGVREAGVLVGRIGKFRFGFGAVAGDGHSELSNRGGTDIVAFGSWEVSSIKVLPPGLP